MKKIITLVTVLSFFSFSPTLKAQLVSYGAITHVSGDPSTLGETEVHIINTSESSVTLKIIRTNTSLAAGHESYYCLDQNCYTPAVYTTTFTIAATDTFALLTYADPHGTFGTDQVHYLVYEIADSANNKVSFDFTYDFATGIHDLSPSVGYMLCTQSSTEDMTKVSYGMNNLKNGKLIVRNLLGAVVKELALSDKQGVLSVSTAELPSGIYMYFLYNNDQPVASRKMIISHR